ncbi:hypothetical protein SADUNF_Sadunf12G0080200 [Salix dunnii]|uniref:Uncharacterized protein n=1 Tax=Salix dunnii TaxID=1413687 RepID=A0A835JJ26_9ROSI|nr:hypothetical protein SADUNF_Sadunf12G0080200 [Salix dunnii]
MSFSSATMRTVVSVIIGVVLVMILLLAMLISTFSFLSGLGKDEGGFGGLRHMFLQEKGKYRASAIHRKLLVRSLAMEEPNRIGEKCTGADIVISQGSTAPLSNGIPTYTVQIMNMCATGCDISRIHLRCGWFSSARLIDPKIFKRLRYNDCLVNDGKPLVTGDILTFEYANTFSYPLAVGESYLILKCVLEFSGCWLMSLFLGQEMMPGGSHMKDFDGNDCTDYVVLGAPLSWVIMQMMNLADRHLLASLAETIEKGTSFGASCLLEKVLAEMVNKAVPSIEMVVVLQPSGTLNSLYNDIAPMENPFENNEGEICAIILEPAVENGGFIPRKPEFLNAVRKITKENSALLIFDEVMTGFCLSYGGAQEHFGITPDLTTLGKIIGQKYFSLIYDYRSCLLVHVVGREIIEMIAPAGPMYQAGTLGGNPLAMTTGIHSEAVAGTGML